MGGFQCGCKLAKKKKKKKKKKLANNESEIITGCTNDWEIDTGYAISSGLAILEGKRICLLAIVIFVDWNVLYFCGGLVPLVLTIISASFGIPGSLGIVYTIYKRKQQSCFPFFTKYLKHLSRVILLCAIFNLVAISSIPIYLNTSRESIGKLFNTSMILYPNENWHKIKIDEFQFNFQCCGHAEYIDWMYFDWQKSDYASRDEMSNQQRISDENLRPMAVPFSCCNKRSMKACFHADLSINNIQNTINKNGCAEAISRIVLRSSIFTYCVSTFIIFTQILLAFMLFKIIKIPISISCNCTENGPSEIRSLRESIRNRQSSRTKKKVLKNRFSTISSCSCTTTTTRRYCSSSSGWSPRNWQKNTLKNELERKKCSCDTSESTAAKIRPSLHTEHRIPKKRFYQK